MICHLDDLEKRLGADWSAIRDARTAAETERARLRFARRPWLPPLVGLAISYHHATATGATMALVTVVVFVTTLVLTYLSREIRRFAR